MATNVDEKVADGFGDEWRRFDQSGLVGAEREKIFGEYFRIFPMAVLNEQAIGADFGAGSGRWASLIAPRVQRLICVDASREALAVARENLSHLQNCDFELSSVNDSAIPQASLDFAYSLGVLHHVPDTQRALNCCVEKLKPGAPFLVYLYYRFDNKPAWYATVWQLSELARSAISRMPHWLRFASSQLMAALVYWPLARLSRLLELAGFAVDNLPLSYYRLKTFYVMRNDALDRFGTRLEQRFTRREIAEMMRIAGLRDVVFNDAAPFWCAVGWKP